MELNYINDLNEEQAVEMNGSSHITVAAFRNGKCIFVKRRNSATLELPETELSSGDKPWDIVMKLLADKLGVISAKIEFVTAYSLNDGGNEEKRLLYCADISELGPFPHSDLASVYYLDIPPADKEKWSFPEFQIPLFERAMKFRES